MISAKRLNINLADYEARPSFQYGLLLAITILGAGLRLYRLSEWSFWIDELYTIGRAQTHFEPTILTTYWNAPSLVLIGSVLHFFGVSEWTARLVPALIGIITIPILYFLVQRLFGSAAAMIASLLLAVAPWHIFWSQNARFYTSALLIYTLALFAFFYAFEKDRPLYILLGFLLFYFAYTERLFAAWLIPIFTLYLLVLAIGPFERPAGFRLRNIGLLVFLPIIGIVFLEIFSFLISGKLRFFTSAFLANLEFIFLYRSDNPFKLLGFIVSNIGVPLVIFALFSGVYLLLKKHRTGFFLLIAAVVPVCLLVLANPFVFTKDRYVFLTLTSWIILGAVGVKELFTQVTKQEKLLAWGVLALLVLSALSSDLLYYQVNKGNRLDWKGAFALIQPQIEEDDQFVMFWPELGSYYLGKDGVRWQDIELTTIVNSGKRYWFVLDSETLWANRDVKLWLDENGELIEVKYSRTPEDLFLRVYLYDPGRRE